VPASQRVDDGVAQVRPGRFGWRRRFGRVPEQPHPRPARPFLVDELADEHTVHVSVDVVGPAGPAPVDIDRRDGRLHEVVGPMRVPAEQVRGAVQRR
jgi:hypothetical protein